MHHVRSLLVSLSILGFPWGDLIAQDNAKSVPVKEFRQTENLTISTSKVLALNFTSDGETLATFSADNVLRLFETKTWKLERKVEMKGMQFHSIQFSPDGKWFAATGGSKWTLVYKVEDWTEWLSIPCGREKGYEVSWSPDSQHLAISGLDKRVRIWAVPKKEKRFDLNPDTTFITRAMAWSTDGSKLATASSMAIIVWDTTTGKEIKSFGGGGSHWCSVMFSPGEKEIIAGDDRAYGRVYVFDYKTGVEKYRTRGNHDHSGHNGAIHGLCLGSSETQFLSMGGTRMCIWDFAREKRLKQYTIPTSRILTGSVAFVPSRNPGMIAFLIPVRSSSRLPQVRIFERDSD